MMQRRRGLPVGLCRGGDARAYMGEKTGRAKCPPWLRTLEALEFEFHAKPRVERARVSRSGVAVDRRRANSGRLAKVGIRNADRALGILIHTEQRLAVGKVEQVSPQAELRPFRDPDGIVHVVVDAAKVLRTAQRATGRSAVGGVGGAEGGFARR